MHAICTYVCMHACMCIDLCFLFNADVRVHGCSYVSMCIGTYVCLFKDSIRILVLVCTHSQARCTGPGLNVGVLGGSWVPIGAKVVPFGITL